MADALREEAQRRASQRREDREFEKPSESYYYAPTSATTRIQQVGTFDKAQLNRAISPQRLFSPPSSPLETINDASNSNEKNGSRDVRRSSVGYSKSPGRFRILDEDDERHLLALSSVSLVNTPTNESASLLSPLSASHPPNSSLLSETAIHRDVSPLPMENKTLKAARLAEKDYKFNGNRARRTGGDFIPPRWIPDEESEYCIVCNIAFDDVNDWCSIALSSTNMSIRRHHCRYCGHLVCDSCSQSRLLLPMEYGLNEPQRVCDACAQILRPLQYQLSATIAKHMQTNTIDIATEHCNVRRYMNAPYSSTLNSEIRKAAYSLHNMLNMQYVKDKAIPLRLIVQARGLAFLTIVKGGFIFAPSLGTGLVISRLPPQYGGGWSAPCAISTVGVSWGAVIGIEVTDYVIVLNTDEAVSTFMSNTGQVTIGAGLEVAVGPIGRSGSADVHISDVAIAPAYSYSQSRGFYAGLSLDGSVIMTRNEVNFQFYATQVSPSDLLTGRVPPPRAAEVLYNALSEVLHSQPDVQHASKSASMDSLGSDRVEIPSLNRETVYCGYPKPLQQNSTLLLGGNIAEGNGIISPVNHRNLNEHNTVYNIGNSNYDPSAYSRNQVSPASVDFSMSGSVLSVTPNTSHIATPRHTPPPLPPSISNNKLRAEIASSVDIIY